MNENSTVNFKKHDEKWSPSEKDKPKFRHKNSEGQNCGGFEFQTKATETTGILGTVKCTTCEREMSGSQLGLTEAKGA